MVGKYWKCVGNPPSDPLWRSAGDIMPVSSNVPMTAFPGSAKHSAAFPICLTATWFVGCCLFTTCWFCQGQTTNKMNHLCSSDVLNFLCNWILLHCCLLERQLVSCHFLSFIVFLSLSPLRPYLCTLFFANHTSFNSTSTFQQPVSSPLLISPTNAAPLNPFISHMYSRRWLNNSNVGYLKPFPPITKCTMLFFHMKDYGGRMNNEHYGWGDSLSGKK